MRGGKAAVIALVFDALLRVARRALTGTAKRVIAIGAFFGKLSVVTFGGAHAALAWVAQEAVGNHGWISPAQMVDGLGLAETLGAVTPAVVGVIAKIEWFVTGPFRLELPDPGTLRLALALLAALALVLLLVLKQGIGRCIALCALLGVVIAQP